MKVGLVGEGADSINAPGGGSSWKRTHHLYTASEEKNPTQAYRERLKCLDAVRGLNVMLMVFVDNCCDFKSTKWIDHSPWDVVHLADFVMPLFLFMVGVSMAFSMKKYGGPGLKWKVASRTAKLFVIGCITQGADIWQGGSGIDLQHMRIPGILQRIAWAYSVVAMMKMWLPVYTNSGFVRGGSWDDTNKDTKALFSHYILHWIGAFAFLVLYLVIMLFVTVPSWDFVVPGYYSDPDCHVNKTTMEQTCTSTWVPEIRIHTKCDRSGDLTPKCSATRMVDHWLLGYEHMWHGGFYSHSPWCEEEPDGLLKHGEVAPLWCHKGNLDPEGTLSSMPTVLTTWLGLHFGLVLTHFPDPVYRLKHWGVMSTAMFALGWIIDPFWKMNKQLWSPAYLFFMAGSCGYLLMALYVVYDLKLDSPQASSWQSPLKIFFTPARWVGMNTIFIYLAAPSGNVFGSAQEWIYFNGDPGDNIRDLFHDYIFCENVDNGLCTGHGIFHGHDPAWAGFAWAVFRITFWTCVAGELHRRRWYWAL